MGSLYMPLEVNGVSVTALVDSGSTISVIHPVVFVKIARGGDVTLNGQEGKLRLADGSLASTLGNVQLKIRVGTSELPLEHEMVVAPVEAPVVLGLDFLRAHGCILDLKKTTLTLGDRVHPCQAIQDMPSVFRIAVTETVIIPPLSEMMVPGELQGSPHFTQAIVQARDYPLCNGNIAMAKQVVYPAQNHLPLRIANLSSEPQTLYKGMKVATCEQVDNISDPLETPDTGDCGRPQEMKPEANPDLGTPKYMEIMQEGWTDRLSPKQQVVARNLLMEFQDSFVKSKEDLSTTDVDMHRMEMKTKQSVKQAPRRIPLSKHQSFKEELKRMLRLDIIEPSTSSWSSPLVLVTKKDGSLRVCVDYRLVNSLTVKDSYPLPRIDDSIDALRGSKWFSTLDLSSGYWQVKMDPKDIDKTAFTTPYGLYQFKVMPFGLVNAPATFERLMEHVLAGLHWEVCLIYMDDIVIFSKTFEEHIDRLRLVFARLRKANLKMSPPKCKLFHHKVECLGHVVSEEGVGTDPKKTQTITEWPTPETVTEVRSFLGLCSYYRRFVRGFADMARPLHQLTEKGHIFQWTPDCENSFCSLKGALTSPPILGYPSEPETFILDTDASGQGIGAVLSQEQDGIERVIAFFSRALTRTERQYCVTRRELLAIVKAVKHFHHYLYGRRFVVRTDHGSLRWLLRFKNPEGQMARWLQVLFTYDFEIEHRPGKQHGNADGLSRRPCQECRYCERQEVKEEVGQHDCEGHRMCAISQEEPVSPERWIEPWTKEQLRKWQEEDPILCKVLVWVEAGRKPAWKDIRTEGTATRVYWAEFERLQLVDKVLHKKVEKGTSPDPGLRLVAPIVVREQIFTFLHNKRTGGHLGIHRTSRSARRRFWWPGMKKDVIRWCQHCRRCQLHNLRSGARRAALRQDPVGSPMERIAFDILSFPEETENGNTCVLVLCDYFTKWTEAFPLEDHQAATVADVLVTEVFLRFGVPRLIHSDQAPEFMSELMRELFQLLEIQQTRTCPYRPQSDGLVERFNRTLIDMLSKFCGENQNDWDQHLPFLMCAYRATVNESTGCSPNILMLGREITLPLDLMYPQISAPRYQCQVQYVEWVRRTLQDNFERARNYLQMAAERQKRYYDQRTKDQQFTVGEWVLRFYPPNLRNKLNPPYIGPYLVVKKLGEVTYQIQQKATSRPIAVHMDHLKIFRTMNPPPNWIEQHREVPRSLHEHVGDDISQRGDPEITQEQGVTLERETEELIPVPSERLEENLELSDDPPARRSHRRRQLPTRFRDFEMGDFL